MERKRGVQNKKFKARIENTKNEYKLNIKTNYYY